MRQLRGCKEGSRVGGQGKDKMGRYSVFPRRKSKLVQRSGMLRDATWFRSVLVLGQWKWEKVWRLEGSRHPGHSARES